MTSAVNGLHNGYAEKFVDRCGHHEVGPVQQAAVFLEVLRIAVVQDAVRIPLERLFEFVRLFLEMLPGKDKAEAVAAIVEPVHDPEKGFRILVVFPALVP